MRSEIRLQSHAQRVFFWFLFLLVPVTGNADSAPVTVRYQDIPKLLHEKNEAVHGAHLHVESAQARTGYLERSLLPQAVFYGGGEYFKTGNYTPTAKPYGGVEIGVNLFRGGRDRQEEKIRASQVNLAEASAQVTFQKELSEAQGIYWQILATKELITHLDQAMKLKENGLQAANRRFRRGLVTRTDLTEFEIYGGRLKEQIESLGHENQLSLIRLKAAIGLSEDAAINVPEERLRHEHDESLLKQELQGEKNPEILQLRQSQDVAELQRVKMARWWMPSFDVYGGYLLYTLRDRTFDSTSERVDVVGGVRLQFNLFDGMQSSAESKSYSLQSASLEKTATQRLRHLNAQIKTIQGEMIHLHELLHTSEDRIQQGLSYLKSTQEEYDRGVKNSPDLLGAVERYVSYQEQYVERRRDYQLSKVKLLTTIAQSKNSD